MHRGRLHTFCHAVPDKWHVMGVTLSAGGSFRWLRDTIGLSEKTIASLSGIDPYEILTAEAENAPAGCEGLMFLPYLSGERTPYPDPTARGVFFGLTLRHDKRHLVRSVMKAWPIACAIVWSFSAPSTCPLHRCARGAVARRSLVWRQILADVFGCELVTVNVTESTAYGACLLAGVGTGVYASVPEACATTVKVVDRTEPITENQSRYNEYYPIYHSLYGALKPEFERVAAIQI